MTAVFRRRARAFRGCDWAAALLLAVAVAACGSGPPTIDPTFTGPSQTVVAISMEFEPTVLNLPAGQQVRIVLDNQDAGVPHDIVVFEGDTVYGRSATVTGPGQAQVVFGPLPAGQYQFQDEAHPEMLGTIVLGP